METMTYYLSSLDSSRFEPVRTCEVERVLAFDTGKMALEVRLEPVVLGQDFNRGDIARVIVTPRHEEAELDPVSEFPCFVFITIPVRDGLELRSPLRPDDLEIIGWGELYRSADDALYHRFG